MPVALCAAGCLLQYAKETQRAAMPHIRTIHVERREESLILDAATAPQSGISYQSCWRRENTLASVLDHTRNAMGSRLLKRWLNRPLRDQAELRERQESIATINFWSGIICLCSKLCMELLIWNVFLRASH